MARHIHQILEAVSNRHRPLSVLLALALLISALFTALAWVDRTAAQRDLIAAQEHLLAEAALVEEVTSAIGYGGLIHNFKNYVLRRDTRYYDAAQGQALTASASLVRLQALSHDHPTLVRDFKILQDTVSRYRSALEFAHTAGKDMSVEDLDAAVRVDDSDAVAALQGLRRHAFEKGRREIEQLNITAEVVSSNYVRWQGYTLALAVFTLSYFLFLWLMRRNRRRLGEQNKTLGIQSYILNTAEDMMQAGYWYYVLETRELYWSPGHYALYGRDENDGPLMIEEVAELYHPDDRKMIVEVLHECLRQKSGYDVMSRLLAPGGAVRYLKSKARYLVIDGHAVIAGIVQDVTEAHERESELRAALDTARQASKAKTDFLSIMSHEVRTPLNAIMGILELLRGSDIAEKEKELVTVALSSSNQLLTILTDILDMSKIEAGKLELYSQPFDIEKSVHVLASTYGALATEKGIALNVRTRGAKDTLVVGDEDRIRQIIGNFINNAIKFTEKGAVDVVLELTPIEGGKEAVLRTEVRDSGIGIDALALGKLFQPFEQAQTSDKRRFGGTGLGLSICKRLAEAMGGTVGAQSKAGNGSLFWFEVTLPATPRQQAVQAPEPHNGPLPHCKILVAEDILPNRMLIERMMIGKWGLDVTLVENGKQAIEALKATPGFDLVLMDVQMPEMDGVTATRIIRRTMPELQDLPIVALTANAMKEQQASYLAAGMNHCLTKPIVWQDLQALIRRLMA